MKRITVCLLAGILLCLAACGQTAAPVSTTEQTTAAPVSTETQTDWQALYTDFFDSAAAAHYFENVTLTEGVYDNTLLNYESRELRVLDLNGDGKEECVLIVRYVPADGVGFGGEKVYVFSATEQGAACVFASPMMNPHHTSTHLDLFRDADGNDRIALWYSEHMGGQNSEMLSFYQFDGAQMTLVRSYVYEETRPAERSKGPVYLSSDQVDFVKEDAENYLNIWDELDYDEDLTPQLSDKIAAMQTDADAFTTAFKCVLAPEEVGCETIYTSTPAEET